MKRQLPQPMTSTDMFMGVLIGQIDELMGMLQDRSGQPPRDSRTEGVVRLQEPAAPSPAEPVKEPAQAAQPKAEPEAEDEPEESAEPGTVRPVPPPRAGRGSGAEAWEAFADESGVDFPADAGRNDIIAACVAAGVIAE